MELPLSSGPDCIGNAPSLKGSGMPAASAARLAETARRIARAGAARRSPSLVAGGRLRAIRATSSATKSRLCSAATRLLPPSP